MELIQAYLNKLKFGTIIDVSEVNIERVEKHQAFTYCILYSKEEGRAFDMELCNEKDKNEHTKRFLETGEMVIVNAYNGYKRDRFKPTFFAVLETRSVFRQHLSAKASPLYRERTSPPHPLDKLKEEYRKRPPRPRGWNE